MVLIYNICSYSFPIRMNAYFVCCIPIFRHIPNLCIHLKELPVLLFSNWVLKHPHVIIDLYHLLLPLLTFLNGLLENK